MRRMRPSLEGRGPSGRRRPPPANVLAEVQQWQRSVPGVIAVRALVEKCYPVYWAGCVSSGPEGAEDFFDWYDPGSQSDGEGG